MCMYVCVRGLSRKSPAIVNMSCLHDISVLWQPRGVGWNVHMCEQ